MSRLARNVVALKYYLIIGAFLGSIAFVVALFMPQIIYEGDSSTYADRSVGSPRIDEIVASFDDNEPYVDPLLVAPMAERLLTDEVREAAAEADTPVHLAVASLSAADSNRSPDVLLARLVHAADRDGLFVLIDQDKRATYELRKDGEAATLHLSEMYGEISADSLRDTFVSLDEEAEGAYSTGLGDGPSWLERVWSGISFGVMFSVPIWFLMKLVRWAARRNRSYLEGFS